MLSIFVELVHNTMGIFEVLDSVVISGLVKLFAGGLFGGSEVKTKMLVDSFSGLEFGSNIFRGVIVGGIKDVRGSPVIESVTV